MQQESLASLTKLYERQVPTHNFQSFFQIISSTQERAIYCAIKCFYLDLLFAGKRKNRRQLHTARLIFPPSYDAKIRVCSYHQYSIQPPLANYIFFLNFQKRASFQHTNTPPPSYSRYTSELELTGSLIFTSYLAKETRSFLPIPGKQIVKLILVKTYFSEILTLLITLSNISSSSLIVSASMLFSEA